MAAPQVIHRADDSRRRAIVDATGGASWVRTLAYTLGSVRPTSSSRDPMAPVSVFMYWVSMIPEVSARISTGLVMGWTTTSRPR